MKIIQYFAPCGLGDNLRSMLAFFSFCKKNNIEYYIDTIGYANCFETTSVPTDISITKLFIDTKLGDVILQPLLDIYNSGQDEAVVVMCNLHKIATHEEMVSNLTQFSQFLRFSDTVINYAQKLLKITPFTAIHARLGDKYMNTPIFITQGTISEDSRLTYADAITKISDIITNTVSDVNNIIIFTDNEDIKQHFKNNTLDTKVVHTAMTNIIDTDTQATLDTVTEFYIITKSSKIIALTKSCFSEIAALFANIELVKNY